jgi:3-methyladenine DNA glycosylase AlkD
VADVLAWLERKGTRRNREGMARYGIVAVKAHGVSVGDLRQYAKRIGRDHLLAERLWRTGWYDARTLAALIDDPAEVTPAQMDRWARDFDNWAICDTCCFHLFDKTPYAYGKVVLWARRRDEFVKRAAFALLASLAVHDKRAVDTLFLERLPLVERAATDDRNFVKKGVSWALRTMGMRSRVLNAAATDVARRLAESDSAAARWVGRDALREFARPVTIRRLQKRAS